MLKKILSYLVSKFCVRFTQSLLLVLKFYADGVKYINAVVSKLLQ